MFKKIALTGIIATTLLTAGCASLDSAVKDFESDTTGLDRTATVYSYSGEIIYEDKGMIRVQPTETGNKVIFELDGKRHAFYNATVKITEN